MEKIVADICGYTEEEQENPVKVIEERLPALKLAAEQMKVNSLADYLKYHETIFNPLNSLICYAWNSRVDDEHKKMVNAVYHIAWKKLYAFCKHYNELKDINKIAAHYLCWNKHYSYQSEEGMMKVISLLNGHIWKKDNNYLVTGLHLATGDNTFSVGNKGNQWRNYVKELGLQAIYINNYWSEILKELEKENKIEIPVLPEYYDGHSTDNYKHSVKVSCNWKERQTILEFMGA